MKEDDPFLDYQDEWKNQASWGNITIYTFEKPYSLEDENITKIEVNITLYGVSKEEFEQWKSLVYNHPDNAKNFENKLISSSFTDKNESIIRSVKFKNKFFK